MNLLLIFHAFLVAIAFASYCAGREDAYKVVLKYQEQAKQAQLRALAAKDQFEAATMEAQEIKRELGDSDATNTGF